MYGLVNAAVQDLVCSKFGDSVWLEIKKKAGTDIDTFSRMESYPDEITYKLIGAASEVLKISPDDVQKAFGEYWVLYTGREGYGHLFEIAGPSLRDFLFNLDDLHTRVGQNFTNLKPPSFQFDVLEGDRVRMHYYSDRAGLCPMVIGLLEGLSKHFKTPLTIEHDKATCSREGAKHCEFVLTVPRNNA